MPPTTRTRLLVAAPLATLLALAAGLLIVRSRPSLLECLLLSLVPAALLVLSIALCMIALYHGDGQDGGGGGWDGDDDLPELPGGGIDWDQFDRDFHAYVERQLVTL